MSESKHIIIVGAGPGGLCAGMLLSNRGFKVSIYDKNPDVGGRNRAIHLDDFCFDTGPTFLLMKGVLDEMFELCGRRSEDYLEFMPLNPMYDLVYDDQTVEIFLDLRRIAIHRRNYRRNGYTTLAEHMPEKHQKYQETKGWDADYFLRKARELGESSLVIMNHILQSRTFTEQAYSACLGLLRLCERYGGDRF